jgi:tetratricopeptide (TPR) repeat protein
MPIEALFARNVDAIGRFLTDGARTLLVLQRDADMEMVVKRLLVKLDDSRDDVTMLACEEPFDSPAQWCEAVIARVARAQEPLRAPYKAGGIDLPRVPAATPGLSPAKRLAAYLSATAEALKPVTASLCVVLVPKSVASAPAFQQTLCFLADNMPSARVKLLTTDDRAKPALGEVRALCRRGFIHPFHVAPEQMQAELEHDLSPAGELGALPPAKMAPPVRARFEASQAMLAGFLSSGGRLGDAAKLQAGQLERAQAEGNAGAEAEGLYNLGTTRLKQHHYQEAERLLDRAVELCLDQKRDPLLAMSLTNLGVAMERQRKSEPAIKAYDLAREVLRRIKNRPGEAHVLDCKAASLASLERHEEARRTWQEARAIYQAINAPAMTDVRTAGVADIDTKLARHKQNPGAYAPAPTPVELEVSAPRSAHAGRAGAP